MKRVFYILVFLFLPAFVAEGRAQVIFTDGFESGVFIPPWYYVWDNHGGTGVTFAAAPVYGGTKSMQLHYVKAAGSGDDDEAVYTNSVVGLTHIFARGYVYFKSPEVGGTKDGIQRKLFYSSHNPGAGTWQMMFTSNGTGGDLK